jgi:hypothetical protein
MRSLVILANGYFLESNERNKMTEVLLRLAMDSGRLGPVWLPKSSGKAGSKGPAFFAEYQVKIPLAELFVNSRLTILGQ